MEINSILQNMHTDLKKHESLTDINKVLVSGLVKILKSPISERYCKVGDEAILDVKNKQIKCSGAWFNFDSRWVVESCR